MMRRKDSYTVIAAGGGKFLYQDEGKGYHGLFDVQGKWLQGDLLGLHGKHMGMMRMRLQGPGKILSNFKVGLKARRWSKDALSRKVVRSSTGKKDKADVSISMAS